MATRTERVELILDDHFSTPMAKAAAATALTSRNLHDLDGTSVKASRSTDELGKSVDKNSQSMRNGSSNIDKYSGRLSLLVEAAAAIGPALIPISAVGIPAVTGIAAGMGAAAGAAATLELAFHGVGEALSALDAYQLEPTDTNLQKLRDSMAALPPAGREFVRTLDDMEAPLRDLQGVADAGIFPGFEEGLQSLITLLPDVRDVVASISTEVGRLGADAGKSLAGDEDWQKFFNYIKTDAAPTLDAFARSVGNFTAGLASMITAFAPLSRDFSTGMLDMSRSFRQWAAGLSQTQGFQDFIDYIRQSGPEVKEFLTAVAQALVAVLKAAAPWGSVVLPILSDVAKAFTAIANSPIGPTLYSAAAAMLVFNRASKMLGPSLASTTTSLRTLRSDMTLLASQKNVFGPVTQGVAQAQARMESARATFVKGGAQLAAFSLIASGVADKMGTTNAATLALAGSMAGPWGTAIGGAIGTTLDLQHATDGLTDAISAANKAMESNDPKQMAAAYKELSAQIGKANDDTVWGTHFLGDKIGSIINFTAPLSNMTKFMGQLTGKTGDAEKKLAELEAAQKHATATTVDNAVGTSQAAAAARDYAQAIRTETTAMEANRKATLAAFDAETAWRQALVAARKQADSTNAGIKGNSAAALANRQALSQLAAAWNNQSDAVKNNVSRFNAARTAFIQTATAMGVPIKKARELADAFLDIPKSVVTQIHAAGGEQAYNELQRIKAEVTSIPRTWSTTYYVNQVNRMNKIAAGSAMHMPGSADGSTVPKDGGPYTDRFPYLLAPGERITTNREGQADKAAKTLTLINAGKLTDAMLGLADGGRTNGSGGATYPVPQIIRQTGMRDVYAPKISREIDDLTSRQLARLGRAFDDLSMTRLAKLGKALDQAADAAKQQADDARQALQDTKQQRAQMASTVAGNGRSSLWNVQSQGGVFASSSTSVDPLSILRSDIKNANQESAIEKALISKHISRAALADVVQNGGIAGLQQIQGYSRSQVAELNRLYAQRTRATNRAGSIAANYYYDAKIDQQTRALHQANAHLAAIQRQHAAEIKQLKADQKAAERRHKEAQKSRRENGSRKAVAAGKRNQTRSKHGN